MLNKQEKCIKFWLKNIDSEYDFWNQTAKKKKSSFLTQSYSIVDYNKNLLETTDEIKVLDVGCGPRGALKDKYDLPKNIKVYSCDPLAFLYKNILEKNKIKTEKEIKFCLAEVLSFFYPDNFFDYIIIQNALDHSINPQLALEECMKILKKNGVLYLFHEENEAKLRNYSGLHQWNFSLNETGDFVISNKTTDININEIYKNNANVLSERILTDENKSWIKSEITKTNDIITQVDNSITKIYLTSFMNFIQEQIILSSKKSEQHCSLISKFAENIKKTFLYFNSQK